MMQAFAPPPSPLNKVDLTGDMQFVIFLFYIGPCDSSSNFASGGGDPFLIMFVAIRKTQCRFLLRKLCLPFKFASEGRGGRAEAWVSPGLPGSPQASPGLPGPPRASPGLPKPPQAWRTPSRTRESDIRYAHFREFVHTVLHFCGACSQKCSKVCIFCRGVVETA